MVAPRCLPAVLFVPGVALLGLACGPGPIAGEPVGDVTTDPGAGATSEMAGDENDEGSEGSEGSEDGAPLLPTYWQDVAPITYEHCVVCHRDGGIGPFSLDGYDPTVALAPLAVESVVARRMPPWGVTDDGSCNSWRDSTALSDAEIATITAWFDAGMPEGEPVDDLGVPELPSLEGALSGSTPVFVPEAIGGDLMENDEYRCFLVDPGIESDGYLTGSAVTPGNPGLVHHVFGVLIEPTQNNLESIASMDGESPDRPGWPCDSPFAGVLPKASPIIWAPGQGVSKLPEGTGMPVAAGDLLVAQIHYNLIDPALVGQSDSTTLHLEVEDQVEREGTYEFYPGLLTTLFSSQPHLIPPGEEAHSFTYTVGMSGLVSQFGFGAELWGVFPHAHELGASISIRLIDGQGNETCVAEIPRWDFNWQHYYYMEEPLLLDFDDELEVTCVYDSTGIDEPTSPGWGTQNEMCFLGLFVSAGS